MNRSVIIATIIAVGATGWIVSGQFGQSEAVTTDVAMQKSDPIVSEIAAALQPKRADPTQVHVQIYTAEPRAQQVIVRGTTEAIRTVTIKAETPGRVVATYVEIGQRVKKGDTLVKFAIKDRNAQLKEAEALVRQRQIEYKAAKSLSKKGFSAKTTLAGTKALLDSALAKAQSVRILLSDLVIKAPFDGIVEERQAEIGDFIKDGNSVITIVDESPFLVVGQISEIYVNKIKIGDKGTAKLVTGESIEGVIRFIGKKSDPATRTFRVELLVQNEGNSLRAGVTAETTYSTEEVMATFISPAILTLNDTGILGVRSVDDSDIVHFHAVSVLTDSSTGAWITGLPPQVRLIKVGQEFVRAGEKVNPQSKTAGVQ